MSLKTDIKISEIIDRTLPEICSSSSKMSRLDILQFCWLLKSIGVGNIEINTYLLGKIGKLPEGLDFILKVQEAEDIVKCMESGIKRCSLHRSMLESYVAVDYLVKSRISVTLEVYANSLEGIYNLEKLMSLKGIDLVSCLRISGLGRITSDKWVAAVTHIKTLLKVNIDICPINRFNMGTAILFEAVEAGMDFVTATFTGYGKEYRYVPIEELLASIKMRYLEDIKTDLSVLPELSSKFVKYTHRDIPGNKAIVGKEIFKYESGIHASGIDRNPNTYEPFDPSTIGQKRELVIGKHSGRLSIKKKMQELGFDPEKCDLDLVLVYIRDKSIRTGKGLDEYELMELFRNSSYSIIN